jgi:hypothetical protein
MIPEGRLGVEYCRVGEVEVVLKPCQFGDIFQPSQGVLLSVRGNKKSS